MNIYARNLECLSEDIGHSRARVNPQDKSEFLPNSRNHLKQWL